MSALSQPISCPAALVSAPASGQGKTLTTAALARAWRNRGLKVQAFKCGPDFLDPMILETATGQPVFNIDLAMCGEEDGQALLYQAAATADVIIVEGVMGLFDGTPSSADIALRYGLPVALSIDASGMAQTFGAVAHGLINYQATASQHKLSSFGVIANKVGSSGHADMLRDCLPPHLAWLGALQQDESYALPERHLGLHRAAEIEDLDVRIEAAANALANSSPLPLPPAVSFSPVASTMPRALLAGKTIAIARDAAFCFIYPANIRWLQQMGATLKFFSPLHDQNLPEADAYWLPGGYPELHIEKIRTNSAMQQALRSAHQAQKPILAECGGMMALSQSIDGQAAFGLLEGTSQLHKRPQGLGVQHINLPAGKLGAHTFHYGSFESALAPAKVAETRFGKGEALYQHGSIRASFLHFYFASNPIAAASLFLS